MSEFLINYSYRHIKPSLSLEAIAGKKIGHQLDHMHKSPVSSDVVFSLNGKRHHVSIKVKACSKESFFCEAEHDSMYSALDDLGHKLGQLIRKHKAKLKPKHEKIGDFLEIQEEVS